MPPLCAPSLRTLHLQTRAYRSYLRLRTPSGSHARVPLQPGSVFGLATSRGSRAYQEDAWAAACVHIPPAELRSSMGRSWSRIVKEVASRWTPKEGEEEIEGQVVWFATYDGHGGREVSGHLRDTLHATFESVKPEQATSIVQHTRNLGGYFRRFTGGALERLVRTDLLAPVRAGGGMKRPPPPSGGAAGESAPAPGDEVALRRAEELGDVAPPEGEEGTMTLAERCTLAWLVADRQIQSSEKLNVGGSTASVALLHSLDSPAAPWYSSSLLSVTTAQVGDTRLLLCAVSDGRAIPLTNYHHPDDRAEADRLRKVGGGMITDSFGEARWMGALANTRAFGDSSYKKAGVTAEPEVITQVLKGDEYAFIIGFSDGVGEKVSDQEIVDLCREAAHPSDAAKAVLAFAEELGAEDNGTVLVVPLKGWGKVKGEDTTKAQRDYRKSKTDVFREGRR